MADSTSAPNQSEGLQQRSFLKVLSESQAHPSRTLMVAERGWVTVGLGQGGEEEDKEEDEDEQELGREGQAEDAG